MDNNSIQHYRINGLPAALARVYYFTQEDGERRELRLRRNNLKVYPIDQIEDLVEQIRQENPLTQRGVFDHIRKVLRIGNISKDRVRKIYKLDGHYQIHRPTKRKKSANRIEAVSKGVFQIDLTNIPEVWRQARGRPWKYACFVIDIFTRKLYGRLLRNKFQRTVLDAFTDMNVPIRALQSDNGTEFNALRQHLQEQDIPVYNSATYSPTTQGKVERLNKTFKSTLQHWLNQNIDRNGNSFGRRAFDDFIESYNDTYHDQIKMSPNESDALNAVRRRAPLQEFDDPEFQVGSLVRINRRHIDSEYRKQILLGHAKKSITENWSFDVYTIVRINRTDNNKTQSYTLRDPQGDILRKKFSPSDLLLAYQ